MSKRKNNDFVQLVPRQDKGLVDKANPNDAEYWKKMYHKLKSHTDKKIELLEEELEVALDTIRTLEASVRVSDRLIASLHDELLSVSDSDDDDYDEDDEDLDDIEDDDDGDDYSTPFTRGIGLSITSGKDPQFYSISDGKRDFSTSKKQKIKGVDLEIQPGRGFRIAPRWEDK